MTKHYICPFEGCNTLFLDMYLLKTHFFKTHNGRPFKCDFTNCKWSFATKSKLERHKNSHLNIKWFKVCYKKTDNLNYYNNNNNFLTFKFLFVIVCS